MRTHRLTLLPVLLLAVSGCGGQGDSKAADTDADSGTSCPRALTTQLEIDGARSALLAGDTLYAVMPDAVAVVDDGGASTPIFTPKDDELDSWEFLAAAGSDVIVQGLGDRDASNKLLRLTPEGEVVWEKQLKPGHAANYDIGTSTLTDGGDSYDLDGKPVEGPGLESMDSIELSDADEDFYFLVHNTDDLRLYSNLSDALVTDEEKNQLDLVDDARVDICGDVVYTFTQEGTLTARQLADGDLEETATEEVPAVIWGDPRYAPALMGQAYVVPVEDGVVVLRD